MEVIMALDPQVKTLLEQAAALGSPAVNTVSPTEARALMEARGTDPAPGVYKVENFNIDGPGGPIPLRVYTPKGNGPLPILVWYHGGGWVLGNLNTTDVACRHLCNKAQCIVVSVDYRLAPESKFPAAAEDCFIATKWTSENASSLGGDHTRLAVGGMSAGGNLAASVALMARDRGEPNISHQLLVVPATEPKFDTQSYLDNAEGYALTRDAMIWYWDSYLPEAKDKDNPYAAPMRASDLSGLPSAFIITGEYDPLRDEGEAFGARLLESGVDTQVKRYEGMFHLFFNLPTTLTKGAEAMNDASNALRKSFGI